MKTGEGSPVVVAPRSFARSRPRRPAHARAAAGPGRVRPGTGSRRQDAARDHGDGLRLLLDRLRSDDSPPRRPGGEPDADDRASGQSRHGLLEGVGSPDRA